MAEKKTFPMMAETSWWSLRSQFQKTLPSTVSVSYLKSLLGLKSDQSARNILSPLRQMGIVDDNMKPTARANEWRSDAKYADVCKAIVAEIYPSELAELFPEAPADLTAVKQWFMDVGAIGESAAYKVASTYLLLRSEQIKTEIGNGRSAPNTGEKNKAPKAVTKKPAAAAAATQPEPLSPPKNVVPSSQLAPTVHIDLQIHISPEASAEQIDSIFASMAKHLYGRE